MLDNRTSESLTHPFSRRQSPLQTKVSSQRWVTLRGKLIVDGTAWADMSPKWLTIMNDFRSRRLKEVVYQPRRHSLDTEYRGYLARPSLDTLAWDLLPEVSEIACFTPFQDIIKAPEETQMGDRPFASAFAQLPVLVDEWKKKLYDELAGLVKIPSFLSVGDIASDRIEASSSAISTGQSQTNTEKLHLACALFRTRRGAFSYVDVFLVSTNRRYLPSCNEINRDPTVPIEDRFSIKFLVGAANIVQACGLDPSVATMDDMDRRNARLRSLCEYMDESNIVMDWRNAVCLRSAQRHMIEHIHTNRCGVWAQLTAMAVRVHHG